MTTLTYMTDEELAEQAITTLLDTLGPIETMRFLNLPRERALDSVARHRRWQANLDDEAFLKQVFATEQDASEG